jgi:hypothetical protein
MLSATEPYPQPAVLQPSATTLNLFARRSAIVQHLLNFLDLPIPETQVWETLEKQQRNLAIEVLARLIAKATRVTKEEKENRDR